MSSKKTPTSPTKRSPLLIVMSTIIFCAGLLSIYLAVMYVHNLGWQAIFVGLAGLTSATLAATAFVKNKPEWLLLDLVVPF